MKKILVIQNGGTIGSKDSGGVIVVKQTNSDIIDRYYEACGKDAEFEVISPQNYSSENIQKHNFMQLVDTITGKDLSNYKGVIITHGTDTLSYVSAFLGIYYNFTRVPIVLTGSNYPIDIPESNGVENFICAVKLVSLESLTGVFTVYKNEKGENTVYLATRISEADGFFDRFSSFGGEALGKFENMELILNTSPINPTLSELCSNSRRVHFDNLAPLNGVTYITPYPMLDYNSLILTLHCKAVLHASYHSSTACVKGGKYSVVDFIKRCKDMNVDFYFLTYGSNERMYESTKRILDAGAIPLNNIGKEAAMMKLYIAYNQYSDSIPQIMKNNIYFESL